MGVCQVPLFSYPCGGRRKTLRNKARVGIRRAAGESRRLGRNIVALARIISGDRPRSVALVRVGEPRGLFFPRSEVVLEDETRNGAKVRLNPGVPWPFIVGWAVRLSRRVNIPLVSRLDPKSLASVCESRIAGNPDRTSRIHRGFRVCVSQSPPKPFVKYDDYIDYVARFLLGPRTRAVGDPLAPIDTPG